MPENWDEPVAKAWLVEWTETEVGWGQRPDGAWYYATEEAALEATNRRLAEQRAREKERENRPRNLPLEYSSPELPPVFVPVSAELAKEIREKGSAYRERAEQGGIWRVDRPGAEEI